MAMNKDILGAAISNVRKTFSGQTPAQLIASYGSMDNAQLEMATQEAEQIILHISLMGEISATISTSGIITATIR